jgi:arginase
VSACAVRSKRLSPVSSTVSCCLSHLGGITRSRTPSCGHSGASIPRLSLLDFDAHPDLYTEYGGDRYSHACPVARIREAGLVDRLVQVGIRTLNGHQREQAERFGVRVVDMRSWRGDVHLEFDSPLYVSLDVDVLDPAFASGVSHPEPGGLSVREVISVIQGITAPLVGADIVEYNPSRDPLGLTGMVCAKLLKELAAKMLSGLTAPSD